MSRLALFAFAAAATLAIAPEPATAAVLVFNATLAGANENPAVASPGSGFGIVTIDTLANTLRVQVSFAGLSGLTTASHIHCCATPGTNAGVATQTPTFAGFPLGVTTGSYDQLFDFTQPGAFNAAFLNNVTNAGNVTTARATLFNGIIAGQSYLNIHTNLFPSGEIRGQLGAIPELSTWAMMLAGFGATGVALRRRRVPAVA